MASNARYEAIILAKFDLSQLQTQLNNANNQVTIKPKVQLGQKEISDYMQAWNNMLERMQIGRNKIFNTPAVQADLGALKSAMSDFAAGGQTSVKDVNLAFDDLRTSVKRVGNDFVKVNEDAKSGLTGLANEMGIAIARTLTWAGAMTLLYGSLAQIKAAVTYIVELNKNLTNIQLVTNMSSSSVRELGKGFNDLALNMGVTTQEVAKGSTEWFRQGKTVAETMDLMKATMQVSKLGALDSAQATEYLTSTLNGFNMEAKDASMVVDKLVQLDNNYATSVAEIAEALSRSSNSAQQAGVSFDELASYVTVVSNVTRKNAESIGESFKTMFARMQNVKLGQLFDGEATSINDVEKALDLVNVKLRETDDTFRPMGDVFDEIAKKWDTLNQVEQSAVANAIAGVRQRENFMVLMRNYNQVLEAQKLEMDSAGLATQRYGIYMENIEAKTNRFTATWEKMVNTIINQDLIKFIVDVGTNMMILAGILIQIPMIKFDKGITSLGDLINEIKKIWLDSSDLFVIKGKEVAGSLEDVKTTADYVKESMDKVAGSMDDVRKRTEETIVSQKALSVLLMDTANKLESSGGASEEFKNLAINLNQANKEFQAGQLSAKDYFDVVNDSLTKTDMKKAFGDNKDAAQEFFTGMTLDAISSLKTITDNFEKADITVGEYTDQLNQLGTVFTNLSNTLLTNADSFGLDSASISGMKEALSSAIGSITTAQEELTKLQEINDLVSTASWTIKTGDLKQGTEEYTNMMKEIANAAIATGESFTDMQGNALTSADAIASYLGENQANFYNFSNQLSGKNTQAIQEMVQGVGQILVQLGEAISNFKANISFTPKIVDWVDTGFLGLKVPNIRLEVGADVSGMNLAKTLGSSIGDLGKKLSEYTVPTGNIFNFGDKTAKAANTAKDALKGLEDQWKNTNKQADDAAKNAEKAYQDLLKSTIQMLKDKKNAEKDALKEQLDGYKKIIDAQKKLIDLKKEERDFNNKIADKNKEISDIQNELLELQFDTSQEATARRLELQDQLTKKTGELNDIQSDHEVDSQKTALDTEYDNFKEVTDAKIKVIDDYLKQTGTITAEAINLLATRTDDFYKELLEWNRKFGTGVDEDIIGKWQQAIDYINIYKNAVASASAMTGGGGGTTGGGGSSSGGGGGGSNDPTIQEILSYWGVGPIPAHHDGGFAEGVPRLKSNEEFAKLLKGEFVSTPEMMDNFMTNTLPKMVSSGGGGNVTIDKFLELVVQGNLDSSVLPDVDKMIDMAITKLSKALNQRGLFRNSNSYSI